MTMRQLLMAVVAVVMMSGTALAAVPVPKTAVPKMREKIESKINWGMDGAPINELKTVRDNNDSRVERTSHREHAGRAAPICNTATGVCR